MKVQLYKVRTWVKGFLPFCLLAFLPLFTSCSDLLDTDSELVEFQEDNLLQNPTDSVYSVMGIIYKMQAIADRTVLLGELRGDLTTTTPSASSDLKAIASFDVDEQNAYNRISDYYAVINNCNYYLAHINQELVKNGRRVFEGEYAAVKAFRAWTYLQVALVYGNVPLVTEPLLTEKESQAAMKQTPMDITAICNYFIDDIKPYVDTKLPDYGSINDLNSQKFFIPVRALLGDLCLWAGRYQEAAQYYHDYLSLHTSPVRTSKSSAKWMDADTKEYRHVSFPLSYSASSNECLCYIPMERNDFYGISSNLENIFNSTDINLQYAQVEPTKSLRELSAQQDFCITTQKTDGSIDTFYVAKDAIPTDEFKGDLRFGSVYNYRVLSTERFSRTSNEIQTILKLNSDGVTLYRANVVYLRYAEALNRAGYPQSAFAVLKYGLYQDIVAKYIDDAEAAAAGNLIDFDYDLFTEENTQGVHSRGSGDAAADTLYVLPQPATALATRQDTIAWQQPLVEDYIVREMALETAFEGYRYYDLMRVALRRGDTSYLAAPVAQRNGTRDDALFSKLSNKDNWYLKK